MATEIRIALETKYLQGIPAEYKPRFQAIKRAFAIEEAEIRTAVLLASQLVTDWDLIKTAVKWNITKVDNASTEETIRDNYRLVESANLKCTILIEIIQKESSNFSNCVYTDTQCPEHKRIKYINKMEAFKHLLGKTQAVFAEKLPLLCKYGNNLIHVLKTGAEISFLGSVWDSDPYHLPTNSALTFIEESKTASPTPSPSTTLSEPSASPSPNSSEPSPSPLPLLSSPTDFPPLSTNSEKKPDPTPSAANTGKPKRPPMKQKQKPIVNGSLP